VLAPAGLTESQVAVLVGVQVQVLLVVTVMLPLPPPAPAEALEGEMAKLQHEGVVAEFVRDMADLLPALSMD